MVDLGSFLVCAWLAQRVEGVLDWVQDKHDVSGIDLAEVRSSFRRRAEKAVWEVAVDEWLRAVLGLPVLALKFIQLNGPVIGPPLSRPESDQQHRE